MAFFSGGSPQTPRISLRSGLRVHTKAKKAERCETERFHVSFFSGGKPPKTPPDLASLGASYAYESEKGREVRARALSCVLLFWGKTPQDPIGSRFARGFVCIRKRKRPRGASPSGVMCLSFLGENPPQDPTGSRFARGLRMCNRKRKRPRGASPSEPRPGGLGGYTQKTWLIRRKRKAHKLKQTVLIL
jgi:hypothetical protein